MEMSPLLPVETMGSAEHRRLLCTYRNLQNAWFRYWEDVSTFWGSLMKCFSSGGNWMILKASCIETGLDKVLSGRLADLRGTLEEMGLAATHLSEGKGGQQMEVLVRTLLTLLSNADEEHGRERPSELPKQQPRVSQPCAYGQHGQRASQPQAPEHAQTQPQTQQTHAMQSQQSQQSQLQHVPSVHSAHQCKPPHVQPQPLLQQIYQQAQQRQRQWQACSQHERIIQEPYQSMLSDRHKPPGFEDVKLADTRTPRSSLTNTGSSLTVRCTGPLLDTSTPCACAGTWSSSVLRQRSASPLLRRPCRSGAQSPSQYQGPIWTKLAAQECIRLTSTGYMCSTATTPGNMQRDVGLAGINMPNHGGSWATPGRSNPGPCYSGEVLFKGA